MSNGLGRVGEVVGYYLRFKPLSSLLDTVGPQALAEQGTLFRAFKEDQVVLGTIARRCRTAAKVKTRERFFSIGAWLRFGARQGGEDLATYLPSRKHTKCRRRIFRVERCRRQHTFGGGVFV